MSDVYDYIDIHAFVRDELRRQGRAQRELREPTGKSEAWVSRVMREEFPIEPAMAEEIGRWFGLGEDERRHLMAMADFAGTDPVASVEAWGELMVTYRRPVVHLGAEAVRALHEGPWYLGALRELARCNPGVSGPGDVHEQLLPRVEASLLHEAWVTLEGHGLVGAPWSLAPLCEDPAVASRAIEHMHEITQLDPVRYFGVAANGSMLGHLLTYQTDDGAARLFEPIQAWASAVQELSRHDTDPPQAIYQYVVALTPLTERQVEPVGAAFEPSPAFPLDRPDRNPTGMQFQDFIAERLEARGVTRRDFAKGIGRDPSWVSRVMSFQADIHKTKRPGVVDDIVDFLELDKRGEARLRALVELVAPSMRRRQRAWEALAGASAMAEVGEVQLASWHDAVVQKLSHLPGFRRDPAWVARQIRPPITPDEAARALRRLEADGMLGIETRAATPYGGMELLRWHWEWMGAVARALVSPPADRTPDVRVMTVALSRRAAQKAEALRESTMGALFGRAAWAKQAERIYAVTVHGASLTEVR